MCILLYNCAPWSPSTRYTVLYAWLSRAMHVRLPNGRICNNKSFFPVIIRRCDLNPSIAADSKCLLTAAAYVHALALHLTKLWRHSRTTKLLCHCPLTPYSSGQFVSIKPWSEINKTTTTAPSQCLSSSRLLWVSEERPINQTMPWSETQVNVRSSESVPRLDISLIQWGMHDSGDPLVSIRPCHRQKHIASEAPSQCQGLTYLLCFNDECPFQDTRFKLFRSDHVTVWNTRSRRISMSVPITA